MIALLLLFAAGTRPGVPPATTPKLKAMTACLAVTRADVEMALGRRVGKAQEELRATESTCDYASAHGQVTVTLQRLQAEPDLPAEMAAMQREIADSSVRPGPALGTGAFFLDIAGAGTQLHVMRGREYLLVSVLGFGEGAAVSAAAEQMARAALGRM